MKTRLMIDLETLGSEPGCVILSIGAVKFNKECILDLFYTRVDPKSCVEAGLRLEIDTFLWWMEQNDQARLEVAKPGVSLNSALHSFNDFVMASPNSWVGEDRNAEIWCRGASFDFPILGAAYRAVGREKFWSHKQERCFRTMCEMNVHILHQSEDSVRHDALADSKFQAEHLIKILNSKL